MITSINSVAPEIIILIIKQAKLRKVAWFLCTARNAVVIILVSVVALGIEKQNLIEYGEPKVFTLTGEIKSGLPPFQPPGSLNLSL